MEEQLLDYSNHEVWCEHIDDIFDRCAAARDPSDQASTVLVRQLYDLLLDGPDAVKQYFDTSSEDNSEQLFAQNACENILLNISRRVGIIISRAPSGFAVATIGIGTLGIERSCRCDRSLAMAMAGAVAASALAIMDCDRNPSS